MTADMTDAKNEEKTIPVSIIEGRIAQLRADLDKLAVTRIRLEEQLTDNGRNIDMTNGAIIALQEQVGQAE